MMLIAWSWIGRRRRRCAPLGQTDRRRALRALALRNLPAARCPLPLLHRTHIRPRSRYEAARRDAAPP